MEKVELTAAEVMSTLNWKKSKVYYWINSGKFEIVERETGTNVLLTDEQIKRLRTETVSESLNEFENSSEISKNVQINTGQNITKHYETVSNSSNFVDPQFYNDALSTMKEMYQTFVQSQSYNMKLLTDGKSEIETEMLELKAENKELSKKVLKFSNSESVKNAIIVIISILLVLSFTTIGILSNCLIKFQTVQKTEDVEQIQTVQDNSKNYKIINDKRTSEQRMEAGANLFNASDVTKPAEAQEVVKPQAPQQAKNVAHTKRK